MINGLGVVGWGVGGIEAEAAMLGQADHRCCMPAGRRIRVDAVTLAEPARRRPIIVLLTVTEMLREKGVVGKFVEFFGDGLANLTLADRATIANMAPEYGGDLRDLPD